jgi:hypothetical protein
MCVLKFSPQGLHANMAPEELSDVTVEACFQECDVNGDGTVTFEEFRDWYSDGGAFGAPVSPSSRLAVGCFGAPAAPCSHSPHGSGCRPAPPPLRMPRALLPLGGPRRARVRPQLTWHAGL